MDIQVAFQMTKERLKPVGRFGYPRIIDVTKPIGQGFFDDRKGAPYHLMFVPITAAIMGYYLSKNLLAEGCVKALKMALKQLPLKSTLIHHSDRGSQYCSAEYVQELQNRHIAISMTQNSDPRENAIAERVNGILKQELLEGYL